MLTIAVLSILLSWHLFPSKVSLVTGNIAPHDIRAHRTVRYKDKIETERRRAEAVARVGKLYDAEPYAHRLATAELDTGFSVIEAARSGSGLGTDGRISKARRALGSDAGIDISYESLRTLVTADESEFEQMRDLAYRLVQESMTREIHDDQPRDILQAKRQIDEQARKYFGDSPYALAVAELAGAAVRPNRILNAERTAEAQRRARESVEPVYRQIVTGELVIGQGERVMPEHIEKFEALGLRNPQIDYRSITSLSLFVSFLVILVIIYLSRYQPEIYKSKKLLLLLSVIVILSTLGLRLGGSLLGLSVSGLQLGYLGTICVIWAGMVLALMLNPQVAVMVVALLSITSGVIMNSELRFPAVTLITGLVAIYSVANIRDRRDEWRAMGAIAITYVAMVWIIGGISGDAVGDMFKSSGWGLVIAAVATWFFRHATAPLERAFGVMTHIALLELADTNKPLLRRLALEAPGTYAHSIAVGQLAEAAAEVIGADGLFARVSAYYHDIGKIKRPHFFIENQRVENAHERLSPSLSTLVVTSHIKDGIELAREYGLPEQMQQIILEHHGTSLVHYFYSQARTEGDPGQAQEYQFRYAGPKPSVREAGIVMLADAVEAASRSLEKPTEARLEALVDRIVSERLADGQLDSSDLTFADISRIKQSFVETLISRLHARIEYPEGAGAEMRKPSDDGDSGTELSEAASGGSEVEKEHQETAAGGGMP